MVKKLTLVLFVASAVALVGFLFSDRLQLGAPVEDSSEMGRVEPERASADHAQQSAVRAPIEQTPVGEDGIENTATSRRMVGIEIQQYLDSRDSYLPILTEYYEEALRGDADAQYLSWRIIDFCDGLIPYYTQRSMEEIIQKLNLRSPWRIAGVETSYRRCIDLANIGLEPFDGWRALYDMAVAQQQPMALTDAGDWPLRIDRESKVGRQHFETAVRSGDAEAMLRIGDKTREIALTTESESLAWILAACKLGASCGPESVRVTELCQFSAVCVLGDDYPGVIARSTELDSHAYELAVERSQQILDMVESGRSAELTIRWHRPAEAEAAK